MSEKNLSSFDPAIAEILVEETERQEYNLEFIASENFVSEAVLEAQGSVQIGVEVDGSSFVGRRHEDTLTL